VRHASGKPFDVAEKIYWRDAALVAYVDRWLLAVRDNGRFKQIYAAGSSRISAPAF
jgi:hypothetical protein